MVEHNATEKDTVWQGQCMCQVPCQLVPMTAIWPFVHWSLHQCTRTTCVTFGRCHAPQASKLWLDNSCDFAIRYNHHVVMQQGFLLYIKASTWLLRARLCRSFCINRHRHHDWLPWTVNWQGVCTHLTSPSAGIFCTFGRRMCTNTHTCFMHF